MFYAKYHYPRIYISILYHDRLRRWINWKNPKDLNEKINWLKFNTDTSLWSRCADKLLVRDYVKECGLENILIPLHGYWTKGAEIEFEKLPDKFVLKPNHGCGDVIVVKNKYDINRESICKKLQSSIEKKFGYELAEWHYLNIQPVILCEKLLEPNNGDLIDYKVWCFDGNPTYIMTCSERDIDSHKAYLNLFDTNWTRLDKYITHKYKNTKYISKPKNLSKMLSYAKTLSKPFPQVRVDFYEINDKIYFGELTFTSRAGMMDYYTEECLIHMGSMVTLPKIK